MASIFDYDPNWKPGGQGSSIFDYDPNWTPPKKPEGGLVASLKQTGGQMVKSAGQLAADVLPGVDRDNALTRTGQGIIDANPTAVRSLSDVADSPWTATKEAVGNAAASIGGVVGARLLGQGITAAAPLAGPAAPLVAGIGQGISWLGPTAMAALPSYGGIREQQIAADPNNEGSLASKALAGAGAATVGLIENRFGPQEWALKALSQGGRDALAKQFAANSLAGAIGKGAVKGAAIEGAEELVQNPIEQLASYQDPTTAANLQDTAFGGVMGALGGGVLGGGAGGLSRTITPSRAQQHAQPQQPAIDPNAGPLSKAASMATQTPELNPLAFTPMEPTGPALETDAQTQERLRAAQFQADAMPFEPSLSFEQGPQPVRATTQDGMPFERIGPEDYDTLNPIRAGEGELLDAERPTAGRTRAPDAIEGQAQRRIGVADDGQQGNQAPMRTLGERVQPAQGENAQTLALPYFTDQKAEQSARKALPFATEQGAQKKAAELSKKRNEPFTVIPHPALADRFAVVPFRNLRTPNEQGQTAQLAAPAPATAVQTQPATESVTNGLPTVEQTTQEAEAARGQEGAKAARQAAPAVADTADNEVVRALRHSKEFIARFKDNPSELKKQQRFTAAAEKKFGISKIAGYRGGLTVHVADRNDGNATVYMQGPSGNFLEAGTIPLSQTAVYGRIEQAAPNQRSESAQPQAPQADQFGNANKMVEQPSTQQEGRREEVAPKPKNLLQLVRKAGGVSMNRLSDVTGDNNPRRAGAVGVFTKKGMDLDSLAELLQQNGFMTEAEVSDVGSGAERATELLRQALAGDRPTSLEDVDSELAKQEERKYRDRIRQRANEMGIRTAVRKFEDIEADVLAQEEQAALAPEDRSAYALDLAGYNEQTPAVKSFLDDAFDPFDEAAEGQSVEAAMRSLGFTEEEINAELQSGKGAQEAKEADARGTQGRDGSADARQADQGQGQQEGLTLDGYTNADIAQRESEQRARDESEQQAQRDAERRAQADAERGSFTLTGSDRPADLLAAQGQGGLFDAPQQPAKPTQQQIDAETAKVPSGVQARVKISLRGLRDIYDRLNGVMRARGKGQILSIEVRDAQEEIAKRSRTLDDFRKMASEKGVDADLALRGMGGVPDFSVFGDPAPVEQSPSDRFRAEVERRKQEREGPQQAQEQPKQAEQARPVYQQTFDQWLEQKWATNRYQEAYIENAGGDVQQAKFAAASGGGNSEASARRAYWSELMNAPRDADVSIEMYDGLKDAQKYDASRHFFKMDDVVRDRLMQRAEQSNAESERIEREIIGPMQAELDRLQAMNERTKSGTSAWNQRAKEAGQLEYQIAQLRAGRMSVDDLPAKWKEGNGSTAQEAQPESFPVNPELESLFESLDGTSTRKANKAKKAIQSDPRADKINMVQDKFLDILQALEDSGAVKINCK